MSIFAVFPLTAVFSIIPSKWNCLPKTDTAAGSSRHFAVSALLPVRGLSPPSLGGKPSLLYHERCPMRFLVYVFRQRSREMLPHFSRLYYTTDVEGTGPEGRLQAQGLLTWFVLKHKGTISVEGTGPEVTDLSRRGILPYTVDWKRYSPPVRHMVV